MTQVVVEKIFWPRLCRFKEDISKEVNGMTLRNVCESQGSNVSAICAIAWDTDVPHESQPMVAEHARKEESSLGKFVLT